MIKRLIVIQSFFHFLMVSLSAQDSIEDLNFLVGTWKVENSDAYETWNLNSDELIGNAYKKQGS